MPSGSSRSPRKNSMSPSRPLNPTATPFVPYPQLFQVQGGITRLGHSSSQADLHGLLNQANASASIQGDQFRETTNQVQNTLLQQATDRARMRVERMNTDSRIGRKEERACVVCWEYVTGMYVVCAVGIHRAHATCADGKLERDPFDCGCGDESLSPLET